MRQLVEAVTIYNCMHSDKLNQGRQALITCYFTRQAAASHQKEDILQQQEEEVMENIDEDVRRAVSSLNFEGF